MYCKKCGTKLDDIDFICPNCGTLTKNAKGQQVQQNEGLDPDRPQPNAAPMPNGPQPNVGPMPNGPQPNMGPMPNGPQPNMGPQPRKVKPKKPREDTGNFGWFVLGFFIPIVGLIMWIVWRKKFPKNAKKLIRGALVGWAVSLVVIMSAIAFCSILSNPAIQI